MGANDEYTESGAVRWTPPLFWRSGWDSFSAEKPRRLQCATGTLPRAAFRIPHIQKSSTPDGVLLFWRSGWDSNPREIALKLISSQPRYDHFDTAAYLIFFARWRELSSQPRYVLLRCPKFSARCPLAKFRPLPLLFARFFRHRRRSQTSPLRYRCIALPIMPQLFPACKGFFANCQHILAA